MNVIAIPEQNVTLVAFHGDRKPDQLNKLLVDTLRQIKMALESIGLPSTQFSSVFKPYGMGHMHATLLGLELIRIGDAIFTANFLNNNGVLREMQPALLLDFCRSIADSRNPLFTIRFGGFRKAHCACTGFDLYEWDCPTGKSEFHAFNRSAYEGTFYAFSPGAVMLTGWPIRLNDHTSFTRQVYGFRRAAENCGFLDKYHSSEKPYWKDDDFYLRLGTLTRFPSNKLDSLLEKVRDFLSSMPPLCVDVRIEHVSFVYYREANLKDIIREIPLVDVLDDPTLIKSLFVDWAKDH
jgi:hypothetical protein